MPFMVLTSVNARYCPVFALEQKPSPPGRPLVEALRANGHLLDPDRVPLSGRHMAGGKTPPDVFCFVAAWWIAERVKDLIEKYEPNRHGFYYVPLFNGDGSPIQTRYYLFDLCDPIDTIVPEASQVYYMSLPDGRQVAQFSDYSKVAVATDRIGGRHVWRERTHLTSQYFMSDELVGAMQAAKITKLQYNPTISV